MSSLFPNVDFQIKGQAERAADSGIRLGIVFLISIILIMVTISLNLIFFFWGGGAPLGHGIVGFFLLMFGSCCISRNFINDAVMLDRLIKLVI